MMDNWDFQFGQAIRGLRTVRLSLGESKHNFWKIFIQSPIALSIWLF